MNDLALTTDAETYNADAPLLDRGAGRWAEYFKTKRLLLVSRDEQLKAIHYDASLTQAQKYERSKALFETTNEIESSLNPAQAAKFEELPEHDANLSKYAPANSFLPEDMLVAHFC